MSDPVIDFRGAKVREGKRLQLGDDSPLRLAEHVLRHGQHRLVRWADRFWRWNGSHYEPISNEAMNAETYRVLDRTDVLRESKHGPRYEPVRAGERLVREVRMALPSRGILVTDSPPTWIGEAGEDPSDLVVCRNGLLNLRTRILAPPSAAFFATAGLGTEYRPDAPAPEQWLAFLGQLWPDDDESIRALRMFVGYLLAGDTGQQKILLTVGPKRAGKGTLGRVVSRLLGEGNVCSPTLTSMSGRFGLAPLIGRKLALVSDARLSGQTNQQVIAERLLSISGEDSLDIDRKFLPPLTVRLPTRFWIMTNELPRVSDASGALASRFIVLMLEHSWIGREDPGLTDRLLEELPAILNWALDGLDDLRREGRLLQPSSSTEAITELEDLGSPVGAFVRDECVVGPAHEVPVDVLWTAWRSWCDANGRERPGTKQTLSRDLRATVPGVRTVQRRTGTGRLRVYTGLGLTNE